MNKKVICFWYVCALLLLSSVTAFASMLIPANEKAKEKAKAPEKSPVIDETEDGDWDLVRVDFIHFAKPDKPGKPGNGGGGGSSGPTCYGSLGVKWKNFPVAYTVNPSNPDNLTEAFVTATIANSSDSWDAETSLEVLDDVYTIDYAAQYGVQDYENVITFGDYPDSGVIGVTSVWFTRRGKKIVEFDMLLNTDFIWGDASIDPSVMDLENIVTHEMGHAIGLDDIYNSTCTHVTMYGYSTQGDINKRSLEVEDIAGLQSIYGP